MIFQLKRCSECGEEKPPTLEYFHSDKRLKSGLKAECKKCSNQRLQRFRSEHPEKIKQYTQNYAESRRDELAGRSKAWRLSNPDKKRNQVKNHIKKHPEQAKATSALNYAVKKGQLPRPATLLCAHQGPRCRTQAVEYHHHKGYAKENWLDVIPVCSPCHNTLNRRK